MDVLITKTKTGEATSKGTIKSLCYNKNKDIDKVLFEVEFEIHKTLEELDSVSDKRQYDGVATKVALVSRYEALSFVRDVIFKIKKEEIGK